MTVQLLERKDGKSVFRAQPAKTAEVTQALARMSKKAAKTVRLMQEGGDGPPEEVAQGTSEESFTAPGRHLLVGDARVPISVNPPAVLALSLPKRVVAGCAVEASARLEFCDAEQATFRWWRAPLGDGGGGAAQVGEGR
eukprot:CAMPEP_0173419814 /NCGR_PEP_ID=MMETSP1357-20121228/1518_1 /TAXON_ID=77926 /ORGANISM="Hemiselmis rufescens, Strain PCC563" /LENGTH=138 /DNA_ID=CAMNT_0014382513 /DNA_START=197 /DNA_END=610 /DNA_ORIENTATION=+